MTPEDHIRRSDCNPFFATEREEVVAASAIEGNRPPTLQFFNDQPGEWHRFPRRLRLGVTFVVVSDSVGDVCLTKVRSQAMQIPLPKQQCNNAKSTDAVDRRMDEAAAR